MLTYALTFTAKVSSAFFFVLPVEFCTTLQWWFHTYSYYFHYFCSFSELILLFFNLLYYSAFSNFSFFLFIFFPLFSLSLLLEYSIILWGLFFILCYYSTFFFLFSLFCCLICFPHAPQLLGSWFIVRDQSWDPKAGVLSPNR